MEKEGRREGGGEQAGREKGLPKKPELYLTDLRKDRLEDPLQSPGSITERLKSKSVVKPSGADTS